jgi:predicted N-acyltransferase
MQGFIKNSVLKIRKVFPNFLKLKLACLGSPVSENCYLGFDKNLSEIEKIECAELIFKEFEKISKSSKAKLLAIKDINDIEKQLINKIKNAKKYTKIISMPTAFLKINFSNLDEYFLKLSHATRKDIRRKLKKLSEIRIERKTNIDDMIDIIYPMYLSTRGRSDWQFETLEKDYFQLVLRQMPENSFCSIYYSSEKPLAANFFLVNENTLIDKYFCAFSEDARNYNLYFISWVENIKFCLENGIKKYIAGQAGYENKTRLGCDFVINWLYFYHRNFIINILLKIASPILAADYTLKPIKENELKSER